jgi:hypothetical protein
MTHSAVTCCDHVALNTERYAVIAAMGTTVTTSMVHGPCDRFYRALHEIRALFLLSVAATILFSFINAGLVYDNVIPSEPDYNSEHFLLLKNESSVNLAKILPNWKTNMSRNILFVHVGKAGGETIKSILSVGCHSRKSKGRKADCLRQLPNSTISDTIQSYFHCFSMHPGAAKDSTSYLYNLRHPVDRTISWYRYIDPQNCRKDKPKSPSCSTVLAISQNPHNGWEAEFFGRCFPTVEDWAQALATPTPTTRPTTTTVSSLPTVITNSSSSNHTDCSKLAWSTLAGDINVKKHNVAAHMVFNFRYYTQHTIGKFASKEVMVVRTENLWQDLGDLDRLLGGDGTFGDLHGSSVTHGSEHHQNRRSISESGAKLLCCALQDELNIFRDLMNRATNLDEETKRESSLKTVTRCGAESWEDLAKQCKSLVSPRITG